MAPLYAGAILIRGAFTCQKIRTKCSFISDVELIRSENEKHETQTLHSNYNVLAEIIL